MTLTPLKPREALASLLVVCLLATLGYSLFVFQSLSRECPPSPPAAAPGADTPAAVAQVRLVKTEPAGPCPALFETPFGPFWARERDTRALDFVVGEQQRQIYERPPVVLAAGDVVLDVGAHLGVFTRVALQRGAQKVVAFEPDPVNAACIRKTFQEEIASGRVALLERAAWDRETTLEFEVDENWGEYPSLLPHASSILRAGATSIAVQATTLDDALAQLKLPRADFVKMDIEGAEHAALSGARKLLSEAGPKLAIAVYHNTPHERLPQWVTVPQLVLSLRPSYRVATKASREEAFFWDAP